MGSYEHYYVDPHDPSGHRAIYQYHVPWDFDYGGFPTNREYPPEKEPQHPPRQSPNRWRPQFMTGEVDMSSWLAQVQLSCGSIEWLEETWYGIKIVLSIFLDMPRRYIVHFLVVLISFLLVLLTGAARVQLVDTTFFHVVGLLIAVLLSLRARHALAQREKLMNSVLDMMNSAKTLVYLLEEDPNKQNRMRSMLEFVFVEAASWAYPQPLKPDEPMNFGAGMSLDELPEEDREAAFVLRAKHAIEISPRPLMLQFREFCDKLFDPESAIKKAGSVEKISSHRRSYKMMEEEVQTLSTKFDFILTFRDHFLQDRLQVVLETVMFVYLVLYPWCVPNDSAMVLAGTTVVMGFIFYGLSALTQQLEDPVEYPSQCFNLRMTFVTLFKEMERDKTMREYTRGFLKQEKADNKDINENLHRRLENVFEAPPPGDEMV